MALLSKYQRQLETLPKCYLSGILDPNFLLRSKVSRSTEAELCYSLSRVLLGIGGFFKNKEREKSMDPS